MPLTDTELDLSVNGASLYTYSGPFLWGQRIRFGDPAGCTVAVQEGLLLTVEVVLSDYPEQVSWGVYDTAVARYVTISPLGTYTLANSTVTNTFSVFASGQYRLDISGRLGSYRLLLDQSRLDPTKTEPAVLHHGTTVPASVSFNAAV